MKTIEKRIAYWGPWFLGLAMTVVGIQVGLKAPAKLHGVVMVCTGMICMSLFCVCTFLSHIVDRPSGEGPTVSA